MIKAADNADVQQALEDRLTKTERHVGRRDYIFGQLETAAGRITKCKAMEGLHCRLSSVPGRLPSGLD